MTDVTRLLARAKHIYRTDGWVSLLRRALLFTRQLLFVHRVYYLYASVLEHDQSLRDDNLTPPFDDVSHIILSTNEEVDDLEVRGYEFRSLIHDARARLDVGARASCVFVGKELANIVWVAMTQQAMDSLKEPPFRVDFAARECWTGDAWTNPKYRRAGLFSYNDIKSRRQQYEQGIRVSKWAVGRNNTPTKTISNRIGARISTEGRLLRILWWKSWKETPTSQEQQSHLARGGGAKREP
jgi:hypothetical protein